ncbi:MAG TPA: hypothetical protein VFD22_08925 [Gemmatimonadaceae bacterium]|nr:hypothetical protein [Gemmatimonadaceae bacterium]
MKRSLLVFALLLSPCLLRAQDDEREIPSTVLRLEDFRLSGPPALALLGIAHASVARPNTPRALIASLVSATGSSGIVPNGYAIETAPYWLSSHSALTLDRYHHATLGDRLRYFTAFSAATARQSARSDSVAPDTRVSIAVRTLLMNGKPSMSLLAISDSMQKSQLDYITRYRRWESVKPIAGRLASEKKRLDRQETLLSTLVTKVLVGPERELRDSTLRTLARRDSARAAVQAAQTATDEVERLENQMDGLEEKLSQLAENYSELDLEPDGFILEAAAGTRAVFSEGEWDRERVDGIGVWLTPMYRLSEMKLELIGVARYLTRVAEYDDDDLLDLGVRAGFDIGKASLSGEWAHRSLIDRDRSTSRWAALFDYPLPAKLHLVASFGSDFRRLNGKRPVVATLGINLGLGAVMIVPESKIP